MNIIPSALYTPLLATICTVPFVNVSPTPAKNPSSEFLIVAIACGYPPPAMNLIYATTDITPITILNIHDTVLDNVFNGASINDSP